MLAGWNLAMKSGASISPLPAQKWPWHWTFALALEKRWEYVAEMGAVYGDEDGPDDDREIPPEIWHDQTRVKEWIERMKARRKEKNSNSG